MDHIDEISEYRIFTVGQITILNYSHVFPPKWVKVEALLANGKIAIVLMQTKDGLGWIDHHYGVSIKTLGFAGKLPFTSIPDDLGNSAKTSTPVNKNLDTIKKWKISSKVDIRLLVVCVGLGFLFSKIYKKHR
jgi:hypothetical protein